MENKQEIELQFNEILNIVRPQIVSVFVVGCLFAVLTYGVLVMLVDQVYESSATLIVNNRNDMEQDVITNEEITSASQLARVYGIIITSDAVMKPVIENLNLEVSVASLVEQVRVSSVESTQVLEVTVSDSDAQRAKLIVDEIISIAPTVIGEMVGAGTVGVVSYAQLAEAPSAPSRILYCLIALVLGMCLRIGMVLLNACFPKTLTTVSEVEMALGIPVIGIIPDQEGYL